jgi:hypothetical protein
MSLKPLTSDQIRVNLAKAHQARKQYRALLDRLTNHELSLAEFVGCGETSRLRVKRVVQAYVAGIKNQGSKAVEAILADLVTAKIDPTKRLVSLGKNQAATFLTITDRF